MSTASRRRAAATLALALASAPAAALAQAPAPRRYDDRGRTFEVAPDGTSRVDEGHRVEGAWVRAGGHRFHAFVGEEAIVQVPRGVDAAAALRTHGLRIDRALMPSIGLWRVRDLRDGVSGLDVAERLAGSGFALAVPDLYLERTLARINVPPNDPRYPGQWFLRRIAIEPAWRRVTGDRATTVVVVDNGCEGTHPDLRANILPGRDVIDNDDDPSPVATASGANHGTSCAGLVAAATDNATGVAGVCPECTVRCVRLLAERGRPVPISADVAAMNFALDVGASVVSNSWGFSEAIPVPGAFAAAMEELFDNGRGGRGTLVVFAAGNDNREVTEDELFGVRGVVTVGALNNFDEVAQFSNYGAPLDLTAPTGTLTTDLTGARGESPDDYTATFGGTSSACPIVSGVAALMFSARPTSTAQEVLDALNTSTRPAPFAQPDDAGFDPAYGHGVVDPAAALRRLFGEPEPVDAGPPDVADAGADVATDARLDVPAADGGVAPTNTDACGCRAPGRSAHRAGGALLAIGLCAVAGRRRRAP
ncbi:MAG: S8 family serine peptidase [Polyangiales bacterium]